MRVAITGATGTLGSALARALIARGDRVVVLSRNPTALRRLEGVQVEAYSYDVVGLREALRAATIDVLVHAACAYGRSGESLGEMVEANVLQPLSLIEAAGMAIGRCIAIGTGLPSDVSPYASTKAQFAQRLAELSTISRMPHSVVSLEHFYGPGDDPGKFLTRVARACIAGEPLDLTSGTQRRDFIHISDVVRAFLFLIDDNQQEWRVIPLGSGIAVPVRQVVEMINAAAGGRSVLRFNALRARANEPECCVADTRYLRTHGWSARIPLEQGIRELVISETKAMKAL